MLYNASWFRRGSHCHLDSPLILLYRWKGKYKAENGMDDEHQSLDRNDLWRLCEVSSISGTTENHEEDGNSG